MTWVLNVEEERPPEEKPEEGKIGLAALGLALVALLGIGVGLYREGGER